MAGDQIWILPIHSVRTSVLEDEFSAFAANGSAEGFTRRT